MDKTLKEGPTPASKNAAVTKTREPENAIPMKPVHCPLCGKEQPLNKPCHMFDGV